MEYLLGIDVGTSGTKSAVFTSDGTLVAEAPASYPLYQPENGWAEQDPNDWWRAVCETLRAVTEQVPAHRICAVGLSGQMHGTVMLDEQGDVIGRAIIWCDGRTGEECREIESRVGR
ncbi:MAG: xylulokinase, partial [Clostridia bacterium]|nr:xylulokinase [Clostridia bacterium]